MLFVTLSRRHPAHLLLAESTNPCANANPFAGVMFAISAIFLPIWAASRGYIFAYTPAPSIKPFAAPFKGVSTLRGRNVEENVMKLNL